MAKSVPISFRADEELKKGLDEFCSKINMPVSVLLGVFAKKVVDEQRIPFTIEAVIKDDFFTKADLSEIEKRYADYRNGKSELISFQSFPEV